jgi:AcrR family transcriptional regulator
VPVRLTKESAGSARRRARNTSIAAIVASARVLYRDRSPNEVTMQEIADHAKVNRGLLHHYFGAKEDLFRAIFTLTSEQAATELRKTGDLLAGLARLRARRDGYVRMLAWALTSGIDPDKFVTHSPAIGELVREAEHFVPEPEPVTEPFDRRIVVAAALALSMGWQLFEPFLLRAASLSDLPVTDARAQIDRLINLMVTRALETIAQPP